MRWVTRKEEPAKTGDLRAIKRFAWRRTEIGRFTVWLEFYWVTERYFEPVGGAKGWWSECSRDICDYF